MHRQTAIGSTPLRDLVPVRSLNDLDSVSYTHLDVYKRQTSTSSGTVS